MIFYIKQSRHIKPIDYACKFTVDKHFVMQFLNKLDMNSNILMIDWVYTQAISSCYLMNDSFLHSMYISLNNLVKRLYLLDFFCSGIQFNLLLNPYPCFISLLYLVFGDDALIS